MDRDVVHIHNKILFSHKKESPFILLLIHLFSQYLLSIYPIPVNILGMGNRTLNKKYIFPAFIEQERKHQLRNVEKSDSNISYFHMSKKKTELYEGKR